MKKFFVFLFSLFASLSFGNANLKSDDLPPPSNNLDDVQMYEMSATNTMPVIQQPIVEGLATEIVVVNVSELQTTFAVADINDGNDMVANNSSMTNEITETCKSAGLMRDDRSHILKHPIMVVAQQTSSGLKT